MKYVMMVLAITVLCGSFNAAFGYIDKAYFEIRTIAEGEGDPPFPFYSDVCTYPLTMPPNVVFRSSYAIWACEPPAYASYDVYAHQLATNPDPGWESETNHTVITNAVKDFLHQYHIFSTFPATGD